MAKMQLSIKFPTSNKHSDSVPSPLVSSTITSSGLHMMRKEFDKLWKSLEYSNIIIKFELVAVGFLLSLEKSNHIPRLHLEEVFTKDGETIEQSRKNTFEKTSVVLKVFYSCKHYVITQNLDI